MKRRWIAAIAACVLLITAAAAAATDNTLVRFYDSAVQLLFHTDNVTLNGKAVFTLDGERFKTAEAQYVQAGVDSLMDLRLLTPRGDGYEVENGYTVIADNGLCYVIEKYNPFVYSRLGVDRNDTIIRRSVFMDSLTAIARPVVGAAAGMLAGKLQEQSLENGGTELQLKLAPGESNELLDSLAVMAMREADHLYYGTDYDNVKLQSSSIPEQPDVMIDDWDGFFAHMYEVKYGQPMPKDFFDKLFGSSPEVSDAYVMRQQEVLAAMEDYSNELCTRYNGGIIAIRVDGTHEHWDTLDEYYVATGGQYVVYEEPMVTLQAHWEKEYGEKKTLEELEQISWGFDQAQYEKYLSLQDKMEKEYLEIAAADGTTAEILVKADGTTEMVRTIDITGRAGIRDYHTVVTGITESTRELTVDSMDVKAETDAEGRLTKAAGNVHFKLTDMADQTYDLGIEFELDVSGYGESTVKKFDPKDWGVTLRPMGY